MTGYEYTVNLLFHKRILVVQGLAFVTHTAVCMDFHMAVVS